MADTMKDDEQLFPQSLDDIKLGAPHYGDVFANHRLRKDAKPPEFFKPPWLDSPKFESGQQFFIANTSGILFSYFCALMAGFVVENLTDALVFTGASVGIEKARKRYTDTLAHLVLWHRGNVFDADSKIWRSIRAVAAGHEIVRRRFNGDSFQNMNTANVDQIYDLVVDTGSSVANSGTRQVVSGCSGSNEEDGQIIPSYIQELSEASCPMGLLACETVMNGATNLVHDESKQNRMNQYDLALVQSGFIGPVLLHPEAIGIAPDDPGMDDYVYFWRVIGYILGLQDEFNICSGGLEFALTISQEIEQQIIVPGLISSGRNPTFQMLSDDFTQGMKYLVPLLSKNSVLAYNYKQMGIEIDAELGFIDWLIYYSYRLQFWLCLNVGWFKEMQNKVLEGLLNKLCDNLKV